MKHLADQGQFTAASQLKASASERRLITSQAGYNKGATMRVAKAGNGWRLYVAVQGQWMDVSLSDMQVKIGRPVLADGDGKTARVQLKLTPADKADWLARAAAAGLTLQAWVEKRCSGKR